MHARERGYVPGVEEAEKKEEGRSVEEEEAAGGKKLTMRGGKGEET